MWVVKLLKPFRYALRGLIHVFRNERNFRFHIVAAIAVIILAIVLAAEKWEWITTVLCIGLMLAAEAFNSSLEYLSDHIEPDYHETIRRVKDASAAGVFILAVMSAIIGTIIFLPKVLLLL